MIRVTVTTGCLCSLCADVYMTRSLSIFHFLAMLISVCPFQALSLHVYTLSSPHVLCLLCYLLGVEVDATLRNHGACISGWKLSIHIDFCLQERVCSQRRVGCQQLLQGVASLSVVMVMLLPMLLCHLQFQWRVVQVGLQSLQKYMDKTHVSKFQSLVHQLYF